MNTQATLAQHAPGVWTEAMKRVLREKYRAARELRQLRELAAELGVGLQQLYVQAHRLGLSREIRKR